MAQEKETLKRMAGRTASPPALFYFAVAVLLWFGCNRGAFAQGDAPELNVLQGKKLSLADALKTTLQHHPSLEIQHWEIAIAHGQKREATSQFDTVLSSGFGQQVINTPLTRLSQSQLPADLRTSESVSNLTAYNLGLSKLFRNGISLSTFAGINRSTDNQLNQLGTNTSQSGFQLVVPLMQGRGSRVVAAKERAAALESSSRELDLRHTAEELLTNTANSYWNLVAAKENLEVAVESERRGRVLLDTVNALIEADQRPRNDIFEVKATLASRTADRIAAQQTFAQARRQLALDMGLSTADVLTVSDPDDNFPAIQSQGAAFDNAILNDYVALALRNRSDALAARKRKVEAEVLLYSAQQSTKPQVNLQFRSGYSQLAEGGAFSNFFGSLASNLHRPDLQAGVTYQFARANNLAEGQKLEAKANAKEAELKAQELEREITASVAIATESVQYSQERVTSAREAVEAFRHTLDGEKEKYRLGQVSMTELLTVEDRLTAALSNEVSAQLDYAVALLNLRSATGTVLRATSNLDIETNAFFTVPENQQTTVNGVRR